MASPSSPITIADQVGVELVESSPGKEEGEFTFTSTSLPIRMGNRLPIAYGGCAISVAVHAAARAAVPEATHRLYSVVGHFLGPATTDQPFRCSVTRTRDTRSFATRRVRVSQLQPQRRKDVAGGSGGDGEPKLQERVCLELIADFHVVEDALMTFSAAPSRPYAAPPTTTTTTQSSPAATCPTRQELEAELTRAGHLSDAARETPREFATMFDGHDRYFEMRFCREGMSGQNLGWARHVPTDQDALPLTARSSAEWYRARPAATTLPDTSSRNNSSSGAGEEQEQRQGRALRTHGEHCAALAFLMDGGLAFLPLVHGHRGFADAGAASSLDFALRILTPDVDMRRWHVRDRVAHAAGAGRSYGEGRLFDEGGRLVASMTQQGILRPAPAPAPDKNKGGRGEEKAVL
ncbi:hypothetical protein SLS62_011005 [Diatrype stigma]|uniref:Thioesterase/thiol ester dehydrase-isomerase n=1 Tax=Diatrype stigma TaxID=117547 RepID=A0AAN9U919_9PEZI